MSGPHVAKRYLSVAIDHVNARHFTALDHCGRRDQEPIGLADDESDFDVHAGREIERAGWQIEARPKGA